ncbi:MAG: glycosyltransferase [Tenacibaculum sp.]
MKVLIISYYWPPAGGPGVQRWLKFVKYLRNYSIEPVVFIPQNPSYTVSDYSLKDEIPQGIELVKCKIIEPNSLLKKYKKKDSQKSIGFLNSNPSVLERLLMYIRANYFIPDARMLWIKPAVRTLKKYLSENKIDLVISTGPPYSLHLIGLRLKQQLGLKWVADFRDPWTSVDYFHLLPLTKKSLNKHYLLEEKVLKTADGVIVVSEHAKKKYKANTKLIKVITNGFDEDKTSVLERVKIDKKFSLTHIGMMNSERNPKNLWQALSELCFENKGFAQDLLLRFVGKIDCNISEELKKSNILHIEKIPYVPHMLARQYQKKSALLLVVVNNYPNAKEMIPGKTFEYLQAKRPIIGIGPNDGDLAEILNRSKAGKVFNYSDKNNLKQYILNLYKQYKNGNLGNLTNNIEKYHRKNLTQQLAVFIRQLISTG